MNLADAPGPMRPPWHIWLVGVLAGVFHGWGAVFGAWYLFTGALTAIIDLVWLLALAAGLLGAILLLLRRRQAMWSFAVTGLVGLASLAFLFVPDAPEQPGAMIIAVNGIMLSVGAGLFLLYARAMARRGVLR